MVFYLIKLLLPKYFFVMNCHEISHERYLIFQIVMGDTYIEIVTFRSF